MKQMVRHGLGIALSAMAFLCNYSPWVREAASGQMISFFFNSENVTVFSAFPVRVYAPSAQI